MTEVIHPIHKSTVGANSPRNRRAVLLIMILSLLAWGIIWISVDPGIIFMKGPSLSESVIANWIWRNSTSLPRWIATCASYSLLVLAPLSIYCEGKTSHSTARAALAAIIPAGLACGIAIIEHGRAGGGDYLALLIIWASLCFAVSAAIHY